MRYDLTKPCGNCPFRTNGGVKLSCRERAVEICQSETFPCHKTVDYSGDSDGQTTDKTQHCAGHLLFHHKRQTDTQMIRVAGRLGIYDPSKLDLSVLPEIVSQASDMLDDHASAEEDETDLEYCGVAESGCENPVGFMGSGGVEENADGPMCDEYCESCGHPMCDNCNAGTGICVMCDEDEDE